MSGFIAWAKTKRAKFLRKFVYAIKRLLVLAQYQYVNDLDKDDKNIRLMNYGWIPPDTQAPLMVLSPEDEPDRCSLQLYHRVAGAIPLEGLDVLEVGSGRGGGAAYIAKYLRPRSMHGVDLTPTSTRFCSEHYDVPGLTFSQGDAERLKFADGAFDAVINVESSHCYVYLDRFVNGVFRVLRPGGYFLIADFRPSGKVDELREELLRPGFEMVDEEDLNPGVLLALDAETEKKQSFIAAKVKPRKRAMFEMFAAVKGSPLYASFASGNAKYVRFVLRKPE